MRDDEKRRVRSTFWNRTEQLRDQFNENHRLKKRVLQKEKDALDPYKIKVNISAERRWRSGLLSHDSTKFVPVQVGDRLLRRRDVDHLPLCLRVEETKSDLEALGIQYDPSTHKVTHPPYERRKAKTSRRKSRIESWLESTVTPATDKTATAAKSSTAKAETGKPSVATPTIPSTSVASPTPYTTSNRSKTEAARTKAAAEDKFTPLIGEKWPVYKPESYESWSKRHPNYYGDVSGPKDVKPNVASSSNSIDKDRRQMLPPPLPALSNGSVSKSTTTETQARATSSTSGYPDYSRPASSSAFSRPVDSGQSGDRYSKASDWQSPLLRTAKADQGLASKSPSAGPSTASVSTPKASDSWGGYYRKSGMGLKGFDAASTLALRSLDPWMS